ncbi:dymeclin-like [Clavelina lepadiformis]|uniref:dymeclin-like n=1 Tax=Clavelina lepadiformis TaxID=159417 RepID=UPI004041D23B
MGTVQSVPDYSLVTTYLHKLAGRESISENDPFWNQLFSNSLPDTAAVISKLQQNEVMKTFCESLIMNADVSKNFITLVKVFLSRCSELATSVECDNVMYIWQTTNALCILRNVCLSLLENMAEEKLVDLFKCTHSDNPVICQLDKRAEIDHLNNFIHRLLDIVIDIPLSTLTYALHLETLNCILVLLSCQVFLSSPVQPIYDVFIHDVSADEANAFIHRLMGNFVKQVTNTSCLISSEKPSKEHSADLMPTISKLSSLFTGNKSFEKECKPTQRATSLSHLSSLIILILMNYGDKDEGSKQINGNVFKTALSIICYTPTSQSQQSSFFVDFSRLYSTLCTTIAEECGCGTLLLYYLMQCNQSIQAFILSKTEIDDLVLPILKIIHSASSKVSNHVYMSLIVLLIFTEDADFNKSVHTIKLQSVPWYTDRHLTNVSLGDVIVSVITRLLYLNMRQHFDGYLNTNCLAALANMSQHFRNIGVYPAQKIFELLTYLMKQYDRCNASLMLPDHHSLDSDHPGPSTAQKQTLEEVIKLLLEVISFCLTKEILLHNENFIYAMLQQSHVFTMLREYVMFKDDMLVIDKIVAFFLLKLEEQNLLSQPMTVSQIQIIISDSAKHMPEFESQKVSSMKFHYVEEESSKDFFIPYIWSIVFNESGMNWNTECLKQSDYDVDV